MEYKIINEKLESDLDAISQVLFNRGIKKEDISHYLNTTDDDILEPTLLDNIEEGCEMLINCIANNKNMFVIPDVDADGFTSAAILINYLSLVNEDYVKEHIFYGINDDKVHGIILDNIPDDISLVVCPDSASNDYEQHKILKDKGIDVLVIDHHEAEKISENAVIINNQLCDYPTKSLSGAGVVYKVCCQLDRMLNVDYAKYFLDLVALGLISDMVSLKDFETKRLIELGLSSIRNPYFKTMCTKNKFIMKDIVNPFTVSFFITPYINATVRMGSKSEKQTLFESMLNLKAYEQIPSTKRGCKGQLEARVEQACRNCTNIKKKQTDARDASLKRIEEIIQENNLLDNKILLITLDKSIDFNKNLTGLIANQLQGKYKKPVVLLRDEGDDWSGSARGVNDSALEDLREFVAETGLLNFAQGHANAFGFSIPKNQLDNFIKLTNDELSNVDFSACYKVDFIYNGFDFNPKDVIQIAEHADIFGQTVEEPRVAVENVKITKDNLTLMSRDKYPTLKITLPNGCSLIRFKSSEEEYEKLYSELGCVKINVVGKCRKNEYYGKTTAQIEIDEYEIIGGQSYYF